ncbi:hypothetical protein CYMTET_53558, partial [Cymbomonas tetramitiformis]
EARLALLLPQSLQTSTAEQRTATNAVAGYGTITVFTTGDKRRHLSAASAKHTHRHMLQDSPPPTVMTPPPPPPPDGMMGDVNDDARFDLFDVQDAMKWVVAEPGYTAIEASAMSHFQRRQLDPTLDYIYSPADDSNCPPGWYLSTPCPSTSDPVYLHLVLANHLRFIDLSDLVHAPLARDEELRFKTKVYDRDSQPVITSSETHVMFEVAVTGLNKEMRVTTGMRMQDTEDGVLVAAAATGDGGFEAVMIGAAHNSYVFEYESGVGIVVMLHTMTSMNATANSRNYAFMGSRLLGSIYLPFTSFDFPYLAGFPPSPFPPGMAPSPPYSASDESGSSGSDGGVSAASAWTWLLLLLGFLAGVALLMGFVYTRRSRYGGKEPTEEELAMFQEFLADHRRDHIVGDEDYTMNPLRYYEMARRDDSNRDGGKSRMKGQMDSKSSFFETFQKRKDSSIGDASQVHRDSYWDSGNHYNPMVSNLKWMKGSLLQEMFAETNTPGGLMPLPEIPDLPDDIPQKVHNPLYEAQAADFVNKKEIPLTEQCGMIKKAIQELERILASPLLTGEDGSLPNDSRLGLVEHLQGQLDQLQAQQAAVECAINTGDNPTADTMRVLQEATTAVDDLCAHVAFCRTQSGNENAAAIALLTKCANFKTDTTGACGHLGIWLNTHNQDGTETAEAIFSMQMQTLSDMKDELDAMLTESSSEEGRQELSEDLLDSMQQQLGGCLTRLNGNIGKVKQVLDTIPEETERETSTCAEATLKTLIKQQQILESIMDKVAVENGNKEGQVAAGIISRCNNIMTTTKDTCGRVSSWLKGKKGNKNRASAVEYASKSQRINYINGILDEVNFTLSEQAKEELQDLSPAALLNEIMHAVESDMMALSDSMERVPAFHHHLMFARIDKGTEKLKEMEKIAQRIEAGDLGALPLMCAHATDVFQTIQDAQDLANRWRSAKDLVVKNLNMNREARDMNSMFALIEAVMSVKSKLRKVNMVSKQLNRRSRAMSGLADDEELEGAAVTPAAACSSMRTVACAWLLMQTGCSRMQIPDELKEKLAARRAAHKMAEHVQAKKRSKTRSGSQAPHSTEEDATTPRTAHLEEKKKVDAAHALASAGAERRMRFNAKHPANNKEEAEVQAEIPQSVSAPAPPPQDDLL